MVRGFFRPAPFFWPFPSTAIMLRGTGQKPETPFIQKIIIYALKSIIRLQSWRVQTLGINSFSTKFWKSGSNHFSMSMLVFHKSFIVPCSKALFIHRNHPVHSLSLNTFLFRIWNTCANVNRISYAYATSGEFASTLLTTFISSGDLITIWCNALHSLCQIVQDFCFNIYR